MGQIICVSKLEWRKKIRSVILFFIPKSNFLFRMMGLSLKPIIECVAASTILILVSQLTPAA